LLFNLSHLVPYKTSTRLYTSNMKTAFVFATLAVGASAFTTHTRVQHKAPTFSRGRSSLNMGGSSGYATSLDGKKARVEKVKGLLENSEMVFTVPASGLTVTEVQKLRLSMPEGTTISVIKNKLMARAVEGTEWEEAMGGMLKGANMWFFIEEDISGSMKALKEFQKNYGKKDSHNVTGGIIEGLAYDSDGVEAISKLPSKIELITKIAGAIKAVPTKVAKVVKAPGDKMARAIKLAGETLE
jgi:large subunit ribosomal protein L10